jgi:hypothetical protein
MKRARGRGGYEAKERRFPLRVQRSYWFGVEAVDLDDNVRRKFREEKRRSSVRFLFLRGLVQ